MNNLSVTNRTMISSEQRKSRQNTSKNGFQGASLYQLSKVKITNNAVYIPLFGFFFFKLFSDVVLGLSEGF